MGLWQRAVFTKGMNFLEGAYFYEQTMPVIRQLSLPMSSVEEMSRRMMFNIMARNQDDHVKNITFLMGPSGKWLLAPAFDLVYSLILTGTGQQILK